MARIERFEDLVAWQRGRELTKALYQVTGNGRFARDRDLRGQMRRAAEGFERGGDMDIELITRTQFDHLYKLATNVARILGGLMRYLQKAKLQRSKYR